MRLGDTMRAVRLARGEYTKMAVGASLGEIPELPKEEWKRTQRVERFGAVFVAHYATSRTNELSFLKAVRPRTDLA
jgi:hypothetical protein